MVVAVVPQRSSVSLVVRMRMRCVYARQHHRLGSLLLFDDNGRGAEQAQDELEGEQKGKEEEMKKGWAEEGRKWEERGGGGREKERVREAEIGI